MSRIFKSYEEMRQYVERSESQILRIDIDDFLSFIEQAFEFGEDNGEITGFKSAMFEDREEFDEDRETEIWDEAFSEGRDTGYTDGYNVGLEESNEEGYEEGYSEGEKSGYDKGYNACYEEHDLED